MSGLDTRTSLSVDLENLAGALLVRAHRHHATDGLGRRPVPCHVERPPGDRAAVLSTSERQLLPRRIARMRRISTYSQTTVTMMPKAPSQPN